MYDEMIFKGNFEEIIYKGNNLWVKYVTFCKLDLFKARLSLYICFLNAYRVLVNIIIPQV